jgi:cytosine/adenosine deaminase-related metal-dependent hydrolase
VRFLKATKIFDGKHWLPNDAVLAIDSQNRLKEVVLETSIDKNKVEFFEGIITPGFVNAHCHLELSHLKDKIKTHTGIPEFGKQIISQRMSGFTKEQIYECANNADAEMWNNGIVAVGDISNADESFKTKQNSKIVYHTFIEILGLNPANKDVMFEFGLTILKLLNSFGLKGSLAPHAPYSTSVELIDAIAKYDKENNFPFSIHNQETEHETKFFFGQENDFKKLYDFLKLDISWFKAPGCSSLMSYIETIKDQKAILVHNTFSDKQDLELAAKKNCFFCFCPNANLYIENKLPDYNLFKNYTNTICFGTDSLASNGQLDLLSEANIILQNSNFSLEAVLQMLTFNGADALAIADDFGQLHVGKNAGLNLLDHTNNQLIFNKKLT